MTRAERLRLVEKAIRQHGTSRATQRWLAEEAGCTDRTIRNDIRIVLDAIQDEGLGTREIRRQRFLEELNGDLGAARGDGKWASVATMSNIKVRILGLDVPPPEPPSPDDEPQDGESQLERLLRETRAMRLDCTRRGAMTAASRLLEAEHGILRDLSEERRRLAEAAAAAQDVEAIVEQITEAIEQLPILLVERIAGAAAVRLED